MLYVSHFSWFEDACFGVLALSKSLKSIHVLAMTLRLFLEFIVLFVMITSVTCCYKKVEVEVENPHEIAPKGHPISMLGWEQMLLMFRDTEVQHNENIALHTHPYYALITSS